MTTLYKPVLIESAEQAEALPVGTVATAPPGEEWPMAYMRSGGDAPPWYASTDGDSYVYHDEMVGRVALVPIEAEEEEDGLHYGPNNRWVHATRYVTPWESV